MQDKAIAAIGEGQLEHKRDEETLKHIGLC